MQLGRGGSLETLEQDTQDEVSQCVEVLLSTVEGQRLELPGYGIPDPTFSPVISVHEMDARIAEWEPRAIALLDADVDLLQVLAHKVEVQIERVD